MIFFSFFLKLLILRYCRKRVGCLRFSRHGNWLWSICCVIRTSTGRTLSLTSSTTLMRITYSMPRWSGTFTRSLPWFWPVSLMLHETVVRSRIAVMCVAAFSACRAVDHIGVGAQSTLGGTSFLPEKYVWKINKMPEFYMIFAGKNGQIFHNNCPKNISSWILEWARAPCPRLLCLWSIISGDWKCRTC